MCFLFAQLLFVDRSFTEQLRRSFQFQKVQRHVGVGGVVR